MELDRRWVLPFLICFGIWAVWPAVAGAYITVPVPTLGRLCESTHVTVVQVESVHPEKGIIVYRKVRDLKGSYPKTLIRHRFDVKGTPAHKGLGDVPIRPDEKDWRYALQWAEPGKTAVLFTLKYDPYGDFGHTYIDGLWYATMCPPRDWEFWYAIYSLPPLLSQWHCGTAGQLVWAVESMLTGKEALVPSLAEGTREDLRLGKAKVRGLKVSPSIRDSNLMRDLATGLLDKNMVPSLVQTLRDESGDNRAAAARQLGLLGPQARDAASALAEVVRNDVSATVRMVAVDALAGIGPGALPALEGALADPRIAQHKELLTRLTEVRNKLK
jgi:hypothetical protein